jgi:nucleotide-binding universal stress UspA family protein
MHRSFQRRRAVTSARSPETGSVAPPDVEAAVATYRQVMRSTETDKTAAPERPVFGSILCGVNGSRQSFEAARQAAVLASDGALLRLLAVAWEGGVGATATALLSRRRATEALERARATASDLGVRAEIDVVGAADAGARLLESARDHDLLVLGVSERSRAGGMLLGRTAAVALHRAVVPVLVARRPPADPFPESILLATDSSRASDRAAELATALARRHDARLAVVAAAGPTPLRRHELARQAAEACAALGYEPEMVGSLPGKAQSAIVTAAEEVGASLVVTGSHGLTGIAALRSVSERVGESAPCSVLVARPSGPA